MISKLSNLITKNLLKRNVISDNEKELYDYGLFMIISYMVFFLISILFGFVLDILFSSVLFFICFCLARNFAGGFHAKTEIKCDFITTFLILISEILIKVFIVYKLVMIVYIMLLVSSLCLFFIQPVDTSQKEISCQEKKRFHRKTIIITVVIIIVSIVSVKLGIYNIIISLSVGLSLASLLLIMGKLQQFLQGSS